MILGPENFFVEGRTATWRAFLRAVRRRLGPVLPWAAMLLLGFALGRGFPARRHAAGLLPEDPGFEAETLPEPPRAPVLPPLREPVRPAPESFPRGARRPVAAETRAAGAVRPSAFSPGRDLVYVDDPRCWWESDHDGDTDDECDHTMHAAAELPFRRLVHLVEQREPGLQLRVQEAYRPIGIHTARSLHSEGRALDLTLGRPGSSKSLSGPEASAALERLAKLAWQAGFDWVYNEWPKDGGPHVHASVRRDAPRLRPAVDGRLPEP